MTESHFQHDSPVGRLVVAFTDRGLRRISFDGPIPEGRPARGRDIDHIRTALDAYFEEARDPDLRVDLTGVPVFTRLVLETLRRRVPSGETATYGALARWVGRPGAARAVGGALNANPIPIVLPCHRVIAADGSLGGFGGGLDRKRRLLQVEGITGLSGGWASASQA